MTRVPLNCEKAEEMLIAWLASELCQKEVVELLKHLKECKSCAAERWEIERTWALMEEWKVPEPSETLVEKFQSEFRVRFGNDKNPGESWFRRITEWWEPIWGTFPGRITSGVSALLLIALIWVLQTPSNNPETLPLVAESVSPPVLTEEKTEVPEDKTLVAEVPDSPDSNLTENESQTGIPSEWIPVNLSETGAGKELGIFVENSNGHKSSVQPVQYVITPSHSGPVYIVFPNSSEGVIEN